MRAGRPRSHPRAGAACVALKKIVVRRARHPATDVRHRLFRVARHAAEPSSAVAMAKKSSHATWGGRFTAGPAELMLKFSESVSFDHRLAPFDIAGSKAHSAMLARVGLLTARERDAIHAGLDAILAEINAGKFVWDTKLED